MAFNFGLVPAGLAGFEQGIGTAEKMRTTAEAIAASQRAEEVRQRAEAERLAIIQDQSRRAGVTPEGLPQAPGGAFTPAPSVTMPGAGSSTVYPGMPQGVAAQPEGMPSAGAAAPTAPTAGLQTPGTQPVTPSRAVLGEEVPRLAEQVNPPRGVRFMANPPLPIPQQGAQAVREKAAEWFNSPAANEYFLRNTEDIAAAKADPLKFYTDVVQPIQAQRAAAPAAAPVQTPIGNIAPAAAAAPAAPAAARAPGKVTLPPQIDALVTSTATQYGISPDSLRRLVFLESKGDPLAKSDKSSAAGLLQFTTDTARQFGLTNPYDPVASLDAGARLWTANKQYLSQALGRAPTDGELYLAHQQGAAGARALLANPEQKAVDALAAVYGGDKQRALTALTNNGGTAGMTAGQFANKWTSKFGGATGVASDTGVPIELKRVQEQRQQYEQTYTQQQTAAYQVYNADVQRALRDREDLLGQMRIALVGNNPAAAQPLRTALNKLDADIATKNAQYQLAAGLAQAEAKSEITKLDTMAARKAGEAGIQQLIDNGQPQMTEQLLQYATGAPHRLVSAEGGYMVERNGTFVLGTDNQPRVFTPDQFKQFFFERTDAGYRQMIAEDRAKVLELQRTTGAKIEEIVAGKIADLNIEQYKQASQTQREAMLKDKDLKTAVVGEKVYIVEGNRVYSIDENRTPVGGVKPAALQQVGTVGANGAIQLSTARPQAGLQ